MIIPLDIFISSLIGLVAVIVAIISLFEVRKQTQQSKEQSEKQTKLLETIANALPYTIKERKPKSVTDKKSKSPLVQNYKKSDDIKAMKLELEKEKLQWQKNKDIAKGISWIIDRLNSDDEDE